MRTVLDTSQQNLDNANQAVNLSENFVKTAERISAIFAEFQLIKDVPKGKAKAENSRADSSLEFF
jgi:hypothetical protein